MLEFLFSLELNPLTIFMFVANLHSKNDNTRDEAADGLLKLAQKCSDVNGLEPLLKSLFDVFNGSQGKLSLASQKISVLQGVGNLSCNKASSGTLQALSDIVVTNFVKILDTEGS